MTGPGRQTSRNHKLATLVLGHLSSRPPHQSRDLNSGVVEHNHNSFNMAGRELSIQSAIRDLNSGVYTSRPAAAKAYNISRSTLQERLAGRHPHAIAHQIAQRLKPGQEEFLVNWIFDEDLRTQPPSHSRVRKMASRILCMNGDNAPLGQNWVSYFLQRNPRVHSIVG
jgi:hypothetical protein